MIRFSLLAHILKLKAELRENKGQMTQQENYHVDIPQLDSRYLVAYDY